MDELSKSKAAPPFAETAGKLLPPRPSPLAPAEDWTVGELLEWTGRFLAQKGADSPRLDAEVLLAHALGCERIALYGERHGEPAPEEVRTKFRDLIRKRMEGCPVAYLVGRKEFFSLALEVTPAVLIPRPDTELVVSECLRLSRKLPAPRVVDIGTGSGAIAVAVARKHPAADVTAIDLSPEALAVAQRNAARHQVADRIRFLQGDLFAPLSPDESFDFILSNPPYIPTGELEQLPAGVRDYEPRLALDGGPDGFAVFERLIAQAREFLAPGGYLLVEIGSPQEEPARRRLAALPGCELADTLRDYSGHPRVLQVRRVSPPS